MSARIRPFVLRIVAVALVLVLGGVITLQARQSALLDSEQQADGAFDTAVQRVASRLVSETGRFEDLLLATTGTVISGTDPRAFRAFVDGIELTERYPGAIGLAFIERIPGPPVQGILRFVFPEPPIDVAGADILLLPEAAQALIDGSRGGARMTARLTSLEPALNVEAGSDGALFAIFAPVGDPLAPDGWVGLPVLAQDFASWLARGEDDVVQVDLYDGVGADPKARLTPLRDEGDAIRRSLRQEVVFGRTWTVDVRQVGAIGGQTNTGVIAVAGLVTTLTLAFAVWAGLSALSRGRQTVLGLAHRATHDELTGLANRRLLRKRLADTIEEQRGDRRTALLYCDLDRFKVANDSLGHTVGDRLLMEVADRFRSTVREGDLVARLGGDEFAVACEVVDEAEAMQAAERLRRSLLEPFVLDGHEVFLSVSIGVAMASDDDVEQLIADADNAMYRSKDAGRGCVTSASTGERAAVHERLQLEAALHRAVDRDELRLHYQPVVRLDTEETVGFEALLRWQHPTLGLLAPDRFIPLAEETGLICELGAWVIRQACADWVAAGGGMAPIAVNLSPRQLFDPDLTESVRQTLASSGMTPEALTLEITESVLATPAAVVQATALRAMGVRVAVDDFGTGYSSLASLRHLPVDVLKVDQRFVAGMGADAVDDAIVEAVIHLGATLGLTVVAEGVETEAQAHALRAVGCELAQGFLFARPAPLETFALLTQGA